MLFKKRSKAFDKDNHFINLALQDEGKKEVYVHDLLDVPNVLDKNTVPVLINADKQIQRRERMYGLMQNKLFGKARYLKMLPHDKKFALPVAQRMSVLWQFDRIAFTARRTFRNLYSMRQDNGLRTSLTYSSLRDIAFRIVHEFYNESDKKTIWKLLSRTVGMYNIRVARSDYYYGMNTELPKHIAKHYINNEPMEEGVYNFGDYATDITYHFAIYIAQAIQQAQPSASRNQLMEDFKFIYIHILAYCQGLKSGARVLSRKRNNNVTQQNVKDIVMYVGYNNFLNWLETSVNNGDILELPIGTPITNSKIEALDDDEFDSKFSINEYGRVTEREDNDDFNLLKENSMVLPDWVDSDLEEEIIKQANDMVEKHVIKAWSYEAQHGKAVRRKFVPTRRDKVAEMKLRKQLSDAGVKPRDVHRILTDKKVFSRKKRVAGGSVMIDFSGSMGWSVDEIREIIRILPASSIAGYVGYDGVEHNDEIVSGDIRIIADKGKYDDSAIDKLHQHGGNNIDLAAIKWLGEQDEPRIFVSDLQVVGVDEYGNTASGLSKECRADIVRAIAKHNIIPIESYDLVKRFAERYAKHVG